MKILNINYSDEIGSQFNNFHLRQRFLKFNCELKFLVSKKDSPSKDSSSMYKFGMERTLQRIGAKINYLSGVQNRHQIWSKRIFTTSEYKEAEVLHFHLIENGWFDMNTFLRAQREKPSVWTWHDLWPTTGHCIQPHGCKQWLNSCTRCPDLSRPFAVKRDRTAEESAWKSEKFISAKFIIHVSTNWTKQKILQKMPALESRIRVIPFGIEVSQNIEPKELLRKKYNFTDSDVIVLVRGMSAHYKNIGSLVKGFEISTELNPNLHLLDIESAGLFRKFNFASLSEYTWISHQHLCELIKLSDLVILPSAAETFGVLGVESQLLGTPVLYQRGTASEEVLGGEDYALSFSGISAERDIREILSNLLESPKRFKDMAKAAKIRAESLYSVERYLKQISDLYSELKSSKNFVDNK
jgi:glycosyltransferase involved in cell wall biosynthesis